MKFNVYLTSGEKLPFAGACWNIERSGALMIMDDVSYRTLIVLAHGQWTHIKLEPVPASVPA